MSGKPQARPGVVRKGGALPTPIMLKAVELLEDGQWHELESVLTEMGKLIPPGRAIRTTELLRRQAKGAPAERHQSIPTSRAISTGRRYIAKQVLMKPRYFEIYPKGTGGRRIINQRVRMIDYPASVVRYREMQDAGEVVIPAHVVDQMLADARVEGNPRGRLDVLHRQQVEAVAIELLEQLLEARWQLQQAGVEVEAGEGL